MKLHLKTLLRSMIMLFLCTLCGCYGENPFRMLSTRMSALRSTLTRDINVDGTDHPWVIYLENTTIGQPLPVSEFCKALGISTDIPTHDPWDRPIMVVITGFDRTGNIMLCRFEIYNNLSEVRRGIRTIRNVPQFRKYGSIGIILPADIDDESEEGALRLRSSGSTNTMEITSELGGFRVSPKEQSTPAGSREWIRGVSPKAPINTGKE